MKALSAKWTGLALAAWGVSASLVMAQDPPQEVKQSSTMVMAIGGSGESGGMRIMTADSGGGLEVMSISAGDGMFFGAPGGALGSDPFSLLTSEDVRKELEMVGDQYEQFQRLQKDYAARIKAQIENNRTKDGFGPENAKGFAEVLSELKSQQQRDLEDLLLPHQRERLQQLSLQSRMKSAGAINALADKRLTEELGIDSEQMDKLRKRAKEINEQFEAKVAKLRQESQEELLNELTRDQREKLAKMIGDQFAFPVNKPRSFNMDRQESKDASGSSSTRSSGGR